MDEHEKLESQLSHYVEQSEPTTKGYSYTVNLADLYREWDYIEFYFNDETGKLDFVRLIKEEPD